MHPDLSPHLHTDKCNRLISLLKQCHEEFAFRKFIGKCNTPYSKMVRCLKEERIARSAQNRRKAQERVRKMAAESTKQDESDGKTYNNYNKS